MGRGYLTIAIIGIGAAIAVVAALLLMGIPGQDVTPDDPGETFDVKCPEGVTFDADMGTLMSEDEITWNVTDMLVPYETSEGKRTPSETVGKELKLEPGYYKVVAGDSDPFDVAIAGKKTFTASWKYYDGEDVRDIQVSYDISYIELAKTMIENSEWNVYGTRYFDNLPKIVVVDDTIRSIESQLSERYEEIGGSKEDRQAYADFLVSFAQMTISYPTGHSGEYDYGVWGVKEYWARPLETLFFGIGDCEDSSALACALFKAAGFKTAMVGVPGHVTAGLVLDTFTPRDISEYKDYCEGYSSITEAAGYAVADSGKTGDYYHGVDTIRKQVPTGYMLKGHVQSFGKTVMNWETMIPYGTAGFYPVD